MKDFAEWTYKDAVAEIERQKVARTGSADAFRTNRDMAERGDFWQDGDLWVGPRGTSATWAAALKEQIRRQHIPGGAVLEGLGNFTRGLFGNQPNIQAVPLGPVSEAEAEAREAEAAELVEALSAWWDRVRLWMHARHAGRRSRWAGWGTLRLRIPEGRLSVRETGDGERTTEPPTLPDFASALEAIDLDAPEPDHCVTLQHPDTQQRAALFHFVGTTEDGQPDNRVELWYTDADATALRILPEQGEPEGPYAYAWGGALPIASMDAEVLLSEPVRRAEAALAFAQTNVVRTGETAGFRERYTTNAEPGGLWLSTPPAASVGVPRTVEDGRGGTLYFHPLPRSLGAGVTTDLVGIVAKSGTDGETRATPTVTIADPVDPDYAIRGADYWRRRVLELMHQAHLAMTGRGESSGFAYEQARASFRGDLDWHVDPAERLLTETLAAVVQMAEFMQAAPAGWLERYRLIVTLTPDPGPVSPAYMQEVRENVKAGLLSRSTAMAQLGVDDTAAEMDAIAQDPASQLGVLKERVGLLIQLKAADPNLSTVAAAVAVGWDPEEARALFGEADAATAQDSQGRDEIRGALARSSEAA